MGHFASKLTKIAILEETKMLINSSFEGVKRRALNRATTFFPSLYQKTIFGELWTVEKQATSVLCSTLNSQYIRDL